MDMDAIDKRFAQAEDAIRRLHHQLLFLEGQSYSDRQALLGLLEIVALRPDIYFSVQRRLHEGRVEALNSPVPEVKVDSADQTATGILQIMAEAIRLDQEKQK